MTQTSGVIGQNSEVEQSEDAKQSLTLKERVRRLFSSTWLLCILVGAIALGFDLYRLGTPSIWFDEAFSVELARQPLPLLWHIIWGPEPNMELYYLFLHFWLGFTSFLGLHSTEFVVRFPSAIFAALSSVMVFLLGRRFLGILLDWLALVSIFSIVYNSRMPSKHARIACNCCSSALPGTRFLHSFRNLRNHKRWWICYVAVTTLAIYAHLFTMVILLAQLTAFVGLMIIPSTWRATTRKQLPAFIVSLVSIGLLSIPMLLVSLHGPKTGWLPVPQLRDIYNLFVVYSANSKFYMLDLIWVLRTRSTGCGTRFSA